MTEEPEKKKASGPGTEELNADLQEICRDLVSVPFEIWAILKPGVQPLSDTEKNLISKPLARIVVKYDVARFMKDEILLLGFLGYSVIKRVRIPKNVANDSGKKGQGKDDISKEPDITAGPGPEQPQSDLHS